MPLAKDIADQGEQPRELPPGVHELSLESQVILAQAFLRGRRIEKRHLKRGP